MTLRPYQLDAYNTLRAQWRMNPCYVAPTGAGKGTVITHMVHNAGMKGKRVLFFVARRELVKDMSRRLDALGLDHGVIMADHPRCRPGCPVQIASIDTVRRRVVAPLADLIIIDEAHFAVTGGWEAVLDRYPGVPRVGMTATPLRLDGRGLGRVFGSLVVGPGTLEMTQAGYLVPTRVFAPSQPDVKAVHTVAGDYNQKELVAVTDVPRLTGDIVKHWLRHARGRPTLGFAIDVGHSKHLRDRFVEAGIRAEHVDAKTPSDERDRVWEGLAAGAVEVCFTVGVASYGLDIPAVSCAILARPTKSLGLYLQQVGRTLRPAPLKQNTTVLDHAGNTVRHGFVDESREWSLEDGIKLGSDGEPPERDPAGGVTLCKMCFCAFRTSLGACPECGWVLDERHAYGEDKRELREMVREVWYRCRTCEYRGHGPLPLPPTCPRCESSELVSVYSKYDPGDDIKRQQKYQEWREIAALRGYKPGWAKVKYKQLYGRWPA